MRSSGTRGMRSFVFALALAASAAGAVPAVAQDQPNDIRPLLDRIDQLERDVNLLQRQVYRGADQGDGAAAANPADTGGSSSLSNEMRISTLEDQVRTLTGQLEQINYSIDQLKHQVDALSSDVDQRLTQLEHPGAATAPVAGGAGAAASAAAETAAAPAPTPPPPPPAGLTPGGANTSGVLGTLSSGGPAGGAPEPQQAAAPADLPNGTPIEQYQYAFGLLRQAKYDDAQTAFQNFVQRFPNDQLAGSAQYWLGETYYVRQKYKDAATAFAYGYQKYPKSGKGADYLLKLGMSLGNLGQKQDACAIFTRLDRDFPSAPGNIKDHESSERQNLGCQ